MKQSVASFWYTAPGYRGVSKLELLAIKSWLDHGFQFVLYTYNPDDQKFQTLNWLFEGFKLKNADEIVPFKDFFSDYAGGGRFCLFRLFPF